MDGTRISTREAALQLGMDTNTLRKYARILGITPALVAHDRKLHTYSADDLRIISERYADDQRKRRQEPRPFPASFDAPSADAYADLQRTVRELAARLARLEANPAPAAHPYVPAPLPPLAPLSVRPMPILRQRLGALPAGMMSRTDVADKHHIPRSTLIRWCKLGDIETADETYASEHGQFQVKQPVTARGLAQFYRLATAHSDFKHCPECPHEHEEAASPLEPLEE